jgi:hypothetical protein
MKGLATLLLAAFFGTLALAWPAHAATDLAVNASIPSGTLLQGQVVAADVTLENNENFPVRVYKIGVHYDWMPGSTFYALDFGDSYVKVESNSAGQPGQILLSCDRAASVGYHQYFFKLDLARFDTSSASWVSDTVITPVSCVYVDSPYRQQALALLRSANDTLAAARALNFSGKSARQDLANATGSLDDGWNAYYVNDFARAMDASYEVTLAINHAKNVESEYQANRNATCDSIELMYIKLGVLSGSRIPEVLRLVNESRSHLQQASDYLEAEDFSNAFKEIMVAETTAERAFVTQYAYQMDENGTDQDRIEAIAAIDAASVAIDQSIGLTAPSAGSLLKDARLKLELAVADFNASGYRNATNRANVAAALAMHAMKTDADYRLQQAREKIALAGPLKSPQARDGLNASLQAYNDSLSLYAREEYAGAIAAADRAYALANDTALAEKAWKEASPFGAAAPGFEAIAGLVALAAAARAAGRPRE